jgi:GH35 family endo-1,4-beta-xylanase
MKRTIIAFAIVATVSLPASAEFKEDRSVMGDAYCRMWNNEVNARIDASIEKHRKADADVAVDAPDGTIVKIEQIESEFKVGCNLFNFDQLGDDAQNAQYKATFGEGGIFDAATIPFYWHAMEPVQGKIRYTSTERDDPDFWKRFLKERGIVRHSDADCPWEWRRPSPDRLIDFCERNNVAMHGHVIIYPNFHPQWVKDAGSREDVEKLFEKRIYDIATYYKGRIPQWDVVNESVDRASTVDSPNDDVCWGKPDLVVPWDYTFKAYRLAERIFPREVKLVVNDSWREIYPPFVKSLMRRGAKIDVVGLQMHIFSDRHAAAISRGEPCIANGTSWAPSDQVEMLKKLSSCGKPIHLSEVTIPSPRSLMDCETADVVQARMVRDNFRLWFAWPTIYRITYWNLVDNVGGEILHSGFYNRDMTKKPAYAALEKLVRDEWRTRITVRATGGRVAFRGFKGRYRLSWRDATGAERAREIVVTSPPATGVPKDLDGLR